METRWIRCWLLISYYIAVEIVEGQLLDLSSPVTATASSWYVTEAKVMFLPQLAIQADTGHVTNTCFLSKKQPHPWFKIEFKSVIFIFNIRLVVRNNTFSYLPDDYDLTGMDNLTVYVSNVSTLGDPNEQRCDSPWKYVPTGNILLDCGRNLKGKFVHVTVPSTTAVYLLICSIVFNREKGPPSPLNLSEVRATVVASGFETTRPPTLAIDGLLLPSEEWCSSLTGTGLKAWLRVDIQTVRYITEVRFLFYNENATTIVNTTIVNIGRSLFKEGSRDNTLCGTLTVTRDFNGSQWKNVTCTLPILGQIVYIERWSDLMGICEIEIFYDNILNIYSPVNITASDQRSANSPIWRPVDGVISSSVRDAWYSLPTGKSWWRIELRSRTLIFRVVIYPSSLDSSRRRAMDGFAVYVGDSVTVHGSSNALCGQPWMATQESAITMNCQGNCTGKYLYFTAADKPGAALFLNEISIHGCEVPRAMLSGGNTQQALQPWQSTNLTCRVISPGCNVTNVTWMGPNGTAINSTFEYVNGVIFSNIVIYGSTFGGLYTCRINYCGVSVSKHVAVSVNAEVTVSPLVFTVLEGHLVDRPFQCLVDGYPMPNITWKKNGVAISHGVTDHVYHVNNRYGKDLRIGRVGLSDNGTVYTCEARQGSFVSNNSGILIVKYDLLFILTPQSMVGMIGGPVTFTCETAGQSANVTAWTVENAKVHPDQVYDITSEQTANNSTRTTLTIKSLQLSHGSFRYRCIRGTAAIPDLLVSSAARAFVLGVISSFQDKTYDIEETLETQGPFSCVFTANPKPNALLQLNKMNVGETYVESVGSDQYNISLSVKDINVRASGLYSCVVSYSGSAVNITSNALLQVVPSVTLQPDTALYITTPMTIRLKCIAFGFPLPTITWNRTVGPDTVSITDSFSSSVDYDNRQTISILTYKDAYLNESGEYTCLASNTLSNSLTASPPVSVQVSAKVSSRPVSQQAVWGGSADFTCVATGYPTPVVEWKLGDRTISQRVTTTKSTRSSTSHLSLTDLHALFHGGQYKCEAGNIAGPRDSTAFNITFQPRVAVPPMSVAVTYEGKLDLTCLVASFPTVNQIVWYRNGKSISSRVSVLKENQTAARSRYSVEVATDAVCGNYSCYSVTSQTAIVTVNAKTLFNTINVAVDEGETVYLECTGVGCPTPSVTWQFQAIGSPNFTTVDDDDVNLQMRSEVISSGRNYSALNITMAGPERSGSYRCIANNGPVTAFSDPKTINVYHTVGSTSPSSDSTIFIIIAVVVAVVVVIIVLVVVRKRFGGRNANITGRNRPGATKNRLEQQELLRLTCPWLEDWPEYENLQFDRSKLEIIGELGEGEFGTVYVAVARGILPFEESTRVAVKTLNGGSSWETAHDFQKELEIMMEFDHPNIIRLLGVCTTHEPLYLITELMDKGDLKKFVSDVCPNEIGRSPSLSLYELLDICSQVSLGLAYLASMKFVHRDIAARNCLVGSKLKDVGLIVKVADFGMAKDVYQSDYYKKRGGILPLRWMAPEAITDGRHTVKSDIWSFGVLMWEVFSFGDQPYFAFDNEVVIAGVIGGYMCLQCPPGCPRIVYHIMKRCWERRPEDRITASTLSENFLALVKLCKEHGPDAVNQLTPDRYDVYMTSSAAESARNHYVVMSSTIPTVDDECLQPTAVLQPDKYCMSTNEAENSNGNGRNRDIDDPSVQNSYDNLVQRRWTESNDYYDSVCETSHLNMVMEALPRDGMQSTAVRKVGSKITDNANAFGEVTQGKELNGPDMYFGMTQGTDPKYVNVPEIQEDVSLDKAAEIRGRSSFEVPTSITGEFHAFNKALDVPIVNENYSSEETEQMAENTTVAESERSVNN